MGYKELRFAVKVGEIQQEPAELIVVNLFEGLSRPGGATAAVDRAMAGRISSVLAAGDFTGKLNETLVLYPVGDVAAQRVLLVGLGKQDKFSLDIVRQVAAGVVKRVRELGVESYATIVHGAGSGGFDLQDAVQALVEGTMLGLYRFTQYKTDLEPREKHDVGKVTLMALEQEQTAIIERGITFGQAIASSACLARDLVNEPANVATPAMLADLARSMAGEHGLDCDVLDRQQMEALGMGALLSVAQGGYQPPYFIIMEHNKAGQGLPTLVLVGKGITFDSGGLDLKPADSMERMKDDMAGGAAVLATMRAVALLDLPLHVVGLVPATENMPGGEASRPLDVVKAMNGKTIEIVNTDAEGRLILADTLTYAARFQPAAVVDLATLTGAVVIALGEGAAGLMTPDDDLARRLAAAGDVSGERVWRLPLFEEYDEQIKSDVADVKNVGGRPAGSITGAMFLKKFIGDYPWAHLDIAGMAWIDNGNAYVHKGPTGFGVRLLVQFLRGWLER